MQKNNSYQLQKPVRMLFLCGNLIVTVVSMGDKTWKAVSGANVINAPARLFEQMPERAKKQITELPVVAGVERLKELWSK